MANSMKLVIATPFYEMKGYSPYISSIIKSITVLVKAGIEVDFWELSGDSYIDRARNTIANRFMDSDYTHLMFIDSDIAWDLEAFANLVKADADFVGAGYPCKNNWDFYGCILNTNENGTPKVNDKGLISAWSIPTGFSKFSKNVFLQLAVKQPENFYIDKGGKVFNFFGRLPPMGEDTSFCRRWAQIGGEIWVEPRCNLIHYSYKGWSGNYHEFLMSCPQPTKKVENVS